MEMPKKVNKKSRQAKVKLFIFMCMFVYICVQWLPYAGQRIILGANPYFHLPSYLRQDLSCCSTWSANSRLSAPGLSKGFSCLGPHLAKVHRMTGIWHQVQLLYGFLGAELRLSQKCFYSLVHFPSSPSYFLRLSLAEPRTHCLGSTAWLGSPRYHLVWLLSARITPWLVL